MVSTNVPEVIESLRASCNRIGMLMTKVATVLGFKIVEFKKDARAPGFAP